MPENEETATTSQAGEKSRRGRPRKAEGIVLKIETAMLWVPHMWQLPH